MRAVVWHGPRKVSVDTVEDPKIQEPTDAVIRVTHTGLCGSDLHLYDHGATLMMKPGDILGHEPLGVVEEVGPGVSHIKPGDRVVVPFNISCGHCYMCGIQMYSQCETTQSMDGRKGAALFGYTHMYGGVAGGQAEYLRVPQAHFGPIRLDDGVPMEAAVLLSDVLPTSWQAVKYADLPEGGTLVIYGLGPIGLMCARIALHLGAGRVIGIDPAPDRRRIAAESGVAVIAPAAVAAVVAAVRGAPAGRGGAGGVAAGGRGATGSFADKIYQTLKIQPDRMAALHQALGSARRGGAVSVIGVYGGWMPKFPVGDLFDKQITLRWGQANVRRWTDDIQKVLADGDPIGAGSLVTQMPSLEEAPDWYSRFRDKEDGVVKVVMRPST